jgi:hypothetical protein
MCWCPLLELSLVLAWCDRFCSLGLKCADFDDLVAAAF